jgi:WD40 repeat protein
VATGAWNGCVRVWDALIGMYLHSVKMNNTVWRMVALAADHFAVCVGEDLLFFSHRHCDDVARVREVAGAHDHTDVLTRRSTCAAHVATGSHNKTVAVWNTYQRLAVLEGCTGTESAISMNSGHVGSTSTVGQSYIFDARVF